jgi:hypothetical protein
MNTGHRLGVEENSLVKRRLRVIAPNEIEMALAIAEIDGIYGLDEVSFDDVSSQLYVAYDASRICLDCIEDVLDKYEVKIYQGWWNHFKEEYYQFVDQNIKDNAKHVPHSCHKVPPHK